MLLARFTCNFKCDKVRVIVAWGKNCSEESDIVFANGYQVCKGTCRVLTVIRFPFYLDSLMLMYYCSSYFMVHVFNFNSLVERPSTPFSVRNQHRFSMLAIVCFRGQGEGVVTDCNTEHAQTGYKIVINRTLGLITITYDT